MVQPAHADARNPRRLSDGGNKAPESRKRRRLLVACTIIFIVSLTLLVVIGRLVSTGSLIQRELEAVAQSIPSLKEEIQATDFQAVSVSVREIQSHTATASEATHDPLWTLGTSIPWLGPNFSAVTELARSADDIAKLGLVPLSNAYSSLDWKTLLPGPSVTNFDPLKINSRSVSTAAYSVRASEDRLRQIDATVLLPEVAIPLDRARVQLDQVTGAMDAAADASQLLPAMLGADVPRTYLLMIQNNAEARASGGIPGALAVLTVDKGHLTLSAQATAGDIGTLTPPVPVDPEQQHIFSGRLGKYMQDVNLTPDFPSAAGVARAMWEKRYGQRVDGVVSIDPVALSYILDATGPIKISEPGLIALAGRDLPTELNGQNLVKTLLSDVYAKIQEPKLQDAYFAGVAQEAFAALSNGKSDAKGLMKGLTKAVEEGRILVWSGTPAEQSTIAKYTVSGSIVGPSVAPAQFGVYFNDGTGAKMDYYVKRTVQLVKDCAKDGYMQTTVRVTSTNTAPADAATSLPAYVTGGGAFGVPSGSVQTTIVTYGPAQSNMETAKMNGQSTDFGAYVHSNRPVGALAVRLAPGESKTVEFTFGKIVQHTEPSLVVTPTVENVKNVILPTENAACD